MKTVFRWIFSVAATLALVAVFANYPQANQNSIIDDVAKNAAEEVPIAAESTPAVPEEPTADGYYLREYDGKLAVFESGSNDPLYVFNVSMATMSDYDKDALYEGIFAQNLAELRGLVEDYTS